METNPEGFFLRTQGSLSLERPEGTPVRTLRKKDLALLVYLALGGQPRPTRTRLAGLLWGGSPEARARHSLSQAIARVHRALGRGALDLSTGCVELLLRMDGDAQRLLRDDEPAVYGGDFLAGFEAGAGAEAFEEWADGVRASLRARAVRGIEQAGARAEAERDWLRAVELGHRALGIDPCWEQAHRRIARAWSELGDAGRALQHLEGYAAYLAREYGEAYGEETRALAEKLHGRQRTPVRHHPP